jgi:hypothetical protein
LHLSSLHLRGLLDLGLHEIDHGLPETGAGKCRERHGCVEREGKQPFFAGQQVS